MDDSQMTFTEDNNMNKIDIDKPAFELKDEHYYDDLVRIKRTRPEPCDQQVRIF